MTLLGPMLVEPYDPYAMPKPGSAEAILCAAVLMEGSVFSLPAPKSHVDILNGICQMTGRESVSNLEALEGWRTTTGRFLSRKEAVSCALNANQIACHLICPEIGLTAEDLW